MKRTLLIVGIICLVLAALSLLISGFSRFGYYHLLDGSSEQYAGLHRRMIIFLIIGIVLAVAGGVCLIIRAKNLPFPTGR